MKTIEVPIYLAKNRSKILKQSVLKNEIIFDVETWRTYFPKDAELKEIESACGKEINRAKIFSLVKKMPKNPGAKDLKKLFLATMIWGFGLVNYGPARTSVMMKNRKFPSVLKKVSSLVALGKYQEAYEAFQLEGCGPAYFTKYLYFLSVKNGKGMLIFDAKVANALEKDCKQKITRYGNVTRKVEWISMILPQSERYMNYMTDMHMWAKKLKVKPEQIELFLSGT